MTGVVLLCIIAIACLVRIAFVIGDIRDALHKVHSVLREHLLVLETMIAKLDGPFPKNEKAIHDAPEHHASRPTVSREQRDREFQAMEDLLRSKTKTPNELLQFANAFPQPPTSRHCL
jgi:hypothetical protein